MKNQIITIYNFIIVFLLVGIYIGYTSLILVLFLILLRMFFCKLKEVTVIMFLVGIPCLGFIFQTYKIPIPGSLIAILIGSILSLNDLIKYFKKNIKTLYLLIFTLLVFTFFYYIGPKNEYATTKLMGIYQSGIVTFLSFILLTNYKGLNAKTISQFFLLYALVLLAGAIDYWGFPKPQDFLDFSFIRNTAVNFAKSNIVNLINYQQIGIAVLISLAFWLSTEKNINIKLILFSVLCFWLVLMSGARQAIFGIPIIIIIWSFLIASKSKLKPILYSTFISIALLYILQQSGVTFLTSIFDSSIDFENRIGGREYLRAIKLFFQNPILGSGLGGFYNPQVSVQQYPHNIILELLCEIGIIGILLILIIIAIHLKRNKINLNFKLHDNSLFFVIWFAFFIRAMISLDLGQNIVVLTSILAISNYQLPKPIISNLYNKT